MNAMIERYLAVALESTPEAKRSEVGPEIRAAVMEMVDLRMEHGEPESEAVRNALIELGEPSRFAGSYQENRRSLIGPDWYPMYIKALKLVPAIVLPIVALVTLLVDIGLDDKSLDSALQSVVGSVLWAAGAIIFWVTLGFAIAERVEGPDGPGTKAKPWTPDDLPETMASRQVGLGSTIGTIITAVIFGGLVFIQDRNGIGVFTRGVSDDLQEYAAINPDIPAGWSWVFYGLILLTIAAAIIRFRGRVWTRNAFLLSLSETVLWSVFIIALAIREPIFNPALGERIDAGGNWWQVGGQANTVIAIVIIATTLPDLWEAWQGYRQQERVTASNPGQLS